MPKECGAARRVPHGVFRGRFPLPCEEVAGKRVPGHIVSRDAGRFADRQELFKLLHLFIRQSLQLASH